MKDRKKDISIKKLIIITFLLALLIFTSGIGYLIFNSWLLSARQSTYDILDNTSENIYNQIYSLIDHPNHINEVNQKIIKNGILELTNEESRNKFFIGVLNSHSKEIYSVGYGTSDGEYYGAMRNESDGIEVIGKDASPGSNTLGVDYDPRAQEWYKAAQELGRPTFSPVFKDYTLDDLTISAAWPIFDDKDKLQGVVRSHMLLSDIGTFLGEKINKYNGHATIIEKDTGYLIANSMGLDNFTVSTNGRLKRYNIDEMGSVHLQEAYQSYIENHEQGFINKSKDQGFFVKIQEIHMEGLDWIVITEIPEWTYMQSIVRSMRLTILFVVLGMVLSFVVYKIITDRLLRPMDQLLQVSESLSSGDLSKRVEVVRNDEIGIISESLNKVADKMQYLINNLEDNVKDRTEELHKANIALEYVSNHDTLTGLPNRRSFESYKMKIDIPDNMPLSVIYADINGLKMTNDIFGHAAGDDLIIKSSEILKQSCRENDVIARVGGDEFFILLPKTNKENVDKVISRIRKGFSDVRVSAVKCSISLGGDTKTNYDQSIESIMSNAESSMYKDKTMNRKSTHIAIIDTIVDELHLRSPREKQHSIFVSELCSKLGEQLELPKPEINKLKRAGYLHDIGKITLDESILFKGTLLEDELEIMKWHPAVGYRILSLFDETLDLAEYVYSHHERWDGKGYPRGLKGEQIPFLSRIISIVETYDHVLNKRDQSLIERKSKAINFIKDGIGKRFDPKIAEVFIQMMDNNELTNNLATTKQGDTLD